MAAQVDDASVQGCPDGYDVYLPAVEPGLAQRLLLDKTGGGSLVLSLGPKDTTLTDTAGDRVLGRGQPCRAQAGEVRVSRRSPEVGVSQGGRVLLRTWSGRPLEGTVEPAQGAKLGDWYLQPAQEPYFDYEFSDLDGTAGVWEDLRGQWKIGVYRDALFQRDHGDKGPFGSSWYETTGPDKALTVAGSDTWDGYRARVAVQATADNTLGLAFYVQDADTFALLSVMPTQSGGLARVSLVGNGKETALDEKPVEWKPGTWYELVVKASGRHVVAGVSGTEVCDSDLGALAPGRIGLFADGPGNARFDDVSVRPLGIQEDDFARDLTGVQELGDAWQVEGAKCELVAGVLRGSAKSFGRFLRVGSQPASPFAAARLQPKSGAAGLCINWAAGTGYVLSIDRKSCTLSRFTDGKKTILGRCEVDATAPVAARLSWSEGRLVGRVADREIVCYDFSAPPRADARRGLFVAGQADFLDFESGTEPQDGATIGTVSGAAQFVPGEGEGTRRPVVGYVWEPSKGAWSPTPLPTDESAQGLVAKAHKAEEPAELWYYQDCPGDTRLTARDCIAPEGATIGLSLSQNKEDRQSGYALEHVVGSGKLALTRLGQTVAESEVGPLTGEGISLWRDGAYVVARAGETGLAFVDAEPLQTPRCCAYATTGGGFGELQLSNRRALAYSFRSVEPDWQPAEGTWMTHSGMACIAWDYWLTGKGEPVATAFNHKPQPADLHVDFWISEYTEGFADGEHRHYPYHDVSLITCAQQRERDSGYRFVVGADGGKAVLLYKKGSQVAETTDSRFSIRMAGHCNIPRSMHVVVSQQTGVLRLSLDGVEALRYEDPEPLAGGLVGIGVEGCAVDFKDLWMVGTGPK